jgi:hypothetical protein
MGISSNQLIFFEGGRVSRIGHVSKDVKRWWLTAKNKAYVESEVS